MFANYYTIINVLLLIVAVYVPSIVAESKEDKKAGLDFLFEKLLKKQENVKSTRLIDFISRGAPSGVDAPIPSIAEYETFRSDKSVNFLSDGAGHVVFRQYRRIRISDLLGSQMRKSGLKL